MALEKKRLVTSSIAGITAGVVGAALTDYIGRTILDKSFKKPAIIIGGVLVGTIVFMKAYKNFTPEQKKK